MKPKVIVIAGPTASGKTDLALKLSESENIEIINADSRQVYKYFDIGTNKGQIKYTQEKIIIDGLEVPEVALEGTTTGWLFDFLEPNIEFNVSKFQSLADVIIQKILDDGKIPVVVGGTGLYIDALIKGYDLFGKSDKSLRNDLNKKSVEELLAMLQSLKYDVDSLNNSERNNKQRLVRKIEKISTINSSDRNVSRENITKKYDFKMLYPTFNKEELMNKIDLRVTDMIEKGFVEEVESLIKLGFKNSKSMDGLGYIQICRYLDGFLDFDEMVSLIQLEHRKYAKRQITWFEGKSRNYDLIRVNQENIQKITRKFLNHSKIS